MPTMAPFRTRIPGASPTLPQWSFSTPEMTATPPQRPWYMTLDQRNRLRRQLQEGQLKLLIRTANPGDEDTILEMIEEAKQWLPTIGTSQWSTDWQDGDGLGRSQRVMQSLKDGTTWLVYAPFEGKEIPVATVTIENGLDSMVWSGVRTRSRRCAYLSRLVTARDFAGLKIGTAIIDWACEYAALEYGAKRMRIDVWTDNYRLHSYYQKQGFRSRGLCDDVSYPSRARFERRTRRWTRHKPSRIERA